MADQACKCWPSRVQCCRHESGSSSTVKRHEVLAAEHPHPVSVLPLLLVQLRAAGCSPERRGAAERWSGQQPGAAPAQGGGAQCDGFLPAGRRAPAACLACCARISMLLQPLQPVTYVLHVLSWRTHALLGGNVASLCSLSYVSRTARAPCAQASLPSLNKRFSVCSVRHHALASAPYR